VAVDLPVPGRRISAVSTVSPAMGLVFGMSVTPSRAAAVSLDVPDRGRGDVQRAGIPVFPRPGALPCGNRPRRNEQARKGQGRNCQSMKHCALPMSRPARYRGRDEGEFARIDLNGRSGTRLAAVQLHAAFVIDLGRGPSPALRSRNEGLGRPEPRLARLPVMMRKRPDDDAQMTR
jgi:hypothetical protein